MKNYRTKIIRLTLWIGFLTTFNSGQQPPSTARPGFSSRNAAIEMAVSFVNPHDLNNAIAARDSKPVETGYEGCPLTLLLIINVAPGGALRYLETPRGSRPTDAEKSAENTGSEILLDADEDLDS